MKTKILIIDDEDTVRNSLKTILTIAGYDVAAAKDSTEAFKLMDEFNPRILLLDLHLKEGLSGLEILKIVKPQRPDLKVVVLTGFGDEDNIREKCLNLGADKFLSKPLSPSQLKKELDEM